MEKEILSTNKEKPVNKKKQIIGIIIVITIVLILIVVGVTNNKKGAEKAYIEYCTISAIKYYYPLKFPDTFELKTINYEFGEYEDRGYELWKTTGTFSAKNKLGLNVYSSYEVWLKFVYEEDKCYYLRVIVDGETLHNSSL